MITKSNFNGYELYTIKNGELELAVTTLGASAVSLKFLGKPRILGYADAGGYREGDAYMGAIVGRCANRIGGAGFSLNGKKYTLSANEGQNQLHGGNEGLPYSKRAWIPNEITNNSLRFCLHSPDGDNGFPGNLEVSVTYTVENNAVRLDFEGISDQETYFAPTSHMYFNLDGSDSILGHRIQIHSDSYVEVDKALIPSGRLLPCTAAFDFSSLRPIGRDYDHAFVLSSSHACTVSAGGMELQLHTDFPALQFYTGSALPESFGKNRGFCIEPEFYPDSPNHPEFPSPLLKAGEHFHKFAEYRFQTL